MAQKMLFRSAHVRDVDGVFRLINKMGQAGRMLRRSKYKIVTMLTNFIVAETEDGRLAGCGALMPLWTDSVEVVSLAVDEPFQRQGVGRALVRELLEQAKRLGFAQVITLTYEVPFFSSLGFRVEPKENFPRKLWRECLECPRLEDCDETTMALRLDGP